MIDAAIVGMGRWGRILVDSVSGGSDVVRFVAGATRTLAKAVGYAAEKELRLHATYEELLADPGVDAVVLASPHTAHFNQILAAADAGKHVYCEKPFCLTAAEARTALDALAAKGLRTAIGHNRRFSPNAVALKRMIDAGEFGDMIQIEGNFSANMVSYFGEWRDDCRESPAGGMTSLGIHVVDMFIDLFGSIRSVRAASRRVAIPLGIDDATTVLVDFEGGQLGYLGTVAATGPLWHVRAFGTRGWGEIVGHDRLTVQMADGAVETKTWEGYDYPGLATVADALESFARDCEGGDPFPVSPEQIHHGTAVLEAIVQSAETGNQIRVAP